MNSPRIRALLATIVVGGHLAAAGPTNGPVVYQLIEGGTLTSAWNAGPPDTIYSLRGTFELVQTNRNPLFTYYGVQNIDWRFGSGTTLTHITGNGSYRFGGEAGFFQDMTLQLQLASGSTNPTLETVVFTNAFAGARRRWPGLDIDLIQTNSASVLHYFALHVAAAPFREIWFSTAGGMTSGNRSSPTNAVSSGDLLSLSGRVVKSNAELISPLGFAPMTGNFGIDAADIAPGGEILFSVNQDVVSESLGPLHHGDLLSDRGRIVQANAELLAAFQPPVDTTDAGLDAVQVLDSGEILFSIATNVFSQSLNTTLGRGDVLSSRGQIFRTNQQLLTAFHPADTNQDYGLDALYVWPSGEIWFSTEDGFQDTQLGPISSGDLLSDGGFIIYRNLELVLAFAPLEDASNFGLDALFVVTDVTPPPPQPQWLALELSPSNASVGLSWSGKGKVFQVEKSGDLTGSFTPVSPILPDLSWIDPGDLATKATAFYRLRTW